LHIQPAGLTDIGPAVGQPDQRTTDKRTAGRTDSGLAIRTGEKHFYTSTSTAVLDPVWVGKAKSANLYARLHMQYTLRKTVYLNRVKEARLRTEG